MTVLYALFALSLFCPVYTYAIYPCILRMVKSREYLIQDIEPTVSVVVIGKSSQDKIKSIKQCSYSNIIEIINENYGSANRANGDIIIFTDTKTQLDLTSIREIVKPFADKRVGCVVGQQTNLNGNSTFWKYENAVKQLESRIGCVSGANESLFAVRKSDMPVVPERVLNKPFYISTKITENGKSVLFCDGAKSYEKKSGGVNFNKHVKDASGYWQALKLFPRMLLFNNGSFVYISHRVMKWFVWLNLVIMLLTSAILGILGSIPMLVILALQIFGYITIIAIGSKGLNNSFGKLTSIGYYFLMLNASYFLALFR